MARQYSDDFVADSIINSLNLLQWKREGGNTEYGISPKLLDSIGREEDMGTSKMKSLKALLGRILDRTMFDAKEDMITPNVVDKVRDYIRSLVHNAEAAQRELQLEQEAENFLNDFDDFEKEHKGKGSTDTGAKFPGCMQIKEFENDKIYIPQGGYCVLRCIIKYLKENKRYVIGQLADKSTFKNSGIKYSGREKILDKMKEYYKTEAIIEEKINYLTSNNSVIFKGFSEYGDNIQHVGKYIEKNWLITTNILPTFLKRVKARKNHNHPTLESNKKTDSKWDIILVKVNPEECVYHAVLYKGKKPKIDILEEIANNFDLFVDYELIESQYKLFNNMKKTLINKVFVFDLETYVEEKEEETYRMHSVPLDVKYKSNLGFCSNCNRKTKVCYRCNNICTKCNAYKANDKTGTINGVHKCEIVKVKKMNMKPYGCCIAEVDCTPETLNDDIKTELFEGGEECLPRALNRIAQIRKKQILDDHLKKNLIIDEKKLEKEIKEKGVVLIYAHNGGKFDNIFVKMCLNVEMYSQLSSGGGIKELRAYHLNEDGTRSGIRFVFKDTYAFTISDLKESCKNFKTKVKKMEDFDIANWTKEDYEKANRQFVIDFDSKEYLKLDIDTKLTLIEEERKTYWKIYCQKDVQSLGHLVKNFENLVRTTFEDSMHNHVGLSALGWKLGLQSCSGLQDQYIPTNSTTIKFIRESIYGGRIIHWKQFFKASEECAGLNALDANSLYPAAMALGLYPKGKFQTINNSDEAMKFYQKHIIRDYLAKDRPTKPYLFIAEVDFDGCNQRYPLIPYRTTKCDIVLDRLTDSEALLYPSGKFTGVYTCVEISEALSLKYKVLNVHRLIFWTDCSKIYENLIPKWYELRLKYKNDNEKIEKEIAKAITIHINDKEEVKRLKAKLEENTNSMAEMLKILLNALYGKHLENIDSSYSFTGLGKTEKDVKHSKFQTKTLFKLPNKQIQVKTKNLLSSICRKPIALGAFILSYSRAIMNRAIMKVGPENVWYGDTDCIYVPVEKTKIITESNQLGGFKNDYGSGTLITLAYFLDLKRYFLKFNKNRKGKMYAMKFNGLNFRINDVLKNYMDETICNKDLAVEEFYRMFYENPEKARDIEVVQEVWRRHITGVELLYQSKLFTINEGVQHFQWRNENNNKIAYPFDYDFKKVGIINKRSNIYVRILKKKCNNIEEIVYKILDFLDEPSCLNFIKNYSPIGYNVTLRRNWKELKIKPEFTPALPLLSDKEILSPTRGYFNLEDIEKFKINHIKFKGKLVYIHRNPMEFNKDKRKKYFEIGKVGPKTEIESPTKDDVFQIVLTLNVNDYPFMPSERIYTEQEKMEFIKTMVNLEIARKQGREYSQRII